MRLTIGPVTTGRAVVFRGEERSAIAKAPVTGPVAIGPLGLAGDEQGDRVHHGGVDMAIHHYPLDHYADWREELGAHPLLATPGGFGENISAAGLTEVDVWIGDRFRLGTALVEVSQGRKPCWKIDHRFQRNGMAASIFGSGRCGWHYRVLEPGVIAEGDALERVERGDGEWSVARVFHAMFQQGASREEFQGVAGLEALSQRWRDSAQAKAMATR